MALANVLSALRELILNEHNLPITYAEKLGLFKTRFPKLTQAELEDLAKIDSKKIHVYTRSIFHGEKNLLKNIFPISFELLKQSWPKYFSESFNGFALARQLHDKFPWRSNLTQDLVENFVKFANEDLSQITQSIPLIEQSLQFERASFYLKREIAATQSGTNSLASNELTAYTVEDLLNLDYVVSTLTRFEIFNFDMLTIQSCFYAKSQIDLNVKQTQKYFAIGARNKTNFVSWVYVPQGIYNLLKEAKLGCKLSDLADRFLQEDKHTDETQAFLEFFKMLNDLIDAGVIYVGAPGTQQQVNLWEKEALAQ